jgi:tetratricopeptide (TPR) repeat protein
VTTNRAESGARARELEAELVTCPPDERAELLVEAGEYWHAAGEDDRAIELYTEAIGLGGEEGGSARVSYAELLFDQGSEFEAQAMLESLRADAPEFPMPYLWAADLMVAREDLEQALRWYDLSVAHLPEQELADYRDSGESFDAEVVLTGRFSVRRDLELPIDELDDLVRSDEARTAEASAALARELEERAEREPEERAQLLLEAAEAWQQAGELDRAAELCTQVIEFGGEDAAFARVGLAAVWYDQDRDDDAARMLDTLREENPPYAKVFQAGAEVFADMGQLETALRWYDQAYATLLAQEAAGDFDDEEFAFEAEEILGGRLYIREELGLDSDELDEAAAALLDGDVDYFEAGHAGEVRVPIWPRDELPRAREKFPDIFDDIDDDKLVREYEMVCRVVSASGVPKISLVPLTAVALAEYAERTGGKPGDEDTHSACAEELAEQGHTVAWPPQRNEPCWCGSTLKYKKCCGRPDLA